MLGLVPVQRNIINMTDAGSVPVGRNRRARTPNSRRFMLTFFSPVERLDLASKIKSLDGVVIEESTFDPSTTHVIARLPNRNEKFLSACASGKWVLAPAYVVESCRHGRWLNEEIYEWTVQLAKRECGGAFSKPGMEQLATAPRRWRLECVSRRGAFQDWRVMLMVQDKVKLEAFKRLVRAGGGVVIVLQRGFLKSASVKASRLSHAFCSDPSWKDVTRAVSSAGMACLHPDFIPDFLLRPPLETCDQSKYLTSTYQLHSLHHVSPTTGRSARPGATSRATTPAAATPKSQARSSAEPQQQQQQRAASAFGGRCAGSSGSSLARVPLHPHASSTSSPSPGNAAAAAVGRAASASVSTPLSAPEKCLKARPLKTSAAATAATLLGSATADVCGGTRHQSADAGSHDSDGSCASGGRRSEQPRSPSHSALELLSRRLNDGAASLSPLTTGAGGVKSHRSALESLDEKLRGAAAPTTSATPPGPRSPTVSTGSSTPAAAAAAGVTSTVVATSLSSAAASAIKSNNNDNNTAAAATTTGSTAIASSSASIRKQPLLQAAVTGPGGGGAAGGRLESPAVSSLLNGNLSGAFAGRQRGSNAAAATVAAAYKPVRVASPRPLSVATASSDDTDDEYHSATTSPLTPVVGGLGASKLQRYMSSSLSRTQAEPKPVKRLLSFSKALAARQRDGATTTGGTAGEAEMECNGDYDGDDVIAVPGDDVDTDDGGVAGRPPGKRLRIAAFDDDDDDGGTPVSKPQCREPQLPVVPKLTPAQLLDQVDVSDIGELFPGLDSSCRHNMSCGGTHVGLPPSAAKVRRRPLQNRFAREWDEITKMYCGAYPQAHVHLHCIQVAMATPVLPSSGSLGSVFQRCMLESEDDSLSAAASRVLHRLLLEHPGHQSAGTLAMYWMALAAADLNTVASSAAPSPLTQGFSSPRCHDNMYKMSRPQLNLVLNAFQHEPDRVGVTRFCEFVTSLLRQSLAHYCTQPEACNGGASAAPASSSSPVSPSLVHYLLWPGGGRCTGMTEALRRLLAIAVKQAKLVDQLAAEIADDRRSAMSSTLPSSFRNSNARLTMLLDIVAMAAECCRLADRAAGTRSRGDALTRELQLSCSVVTSPVVRLMEVCQPEWLRIGAAWSVLAPRLRQLKDVYTHDAANGVGNGDGVGGGGCVDLAFSSAAQVPDAGELTRLLLRLSSRCRKASRAERRNQESTRQCDGSPMRRPVAMAPVASPVHKRNKKGESKLQQSCIKGDVERVRSLLAAGADPNMCDHAGWSPLHEAANYGHAECARALLECGSTVLRGQPGVYLLAAPGDGVTPLHDAASNGHVGVVKLLVDAGGPALLRAVNASGKTPFDLCPHGDSWAHLRALLTDVVAGNNDDDSPSSSQQLASGAGASPAEAVIRSLCVPPLRSDPELALMTRLLARILTSVLLAPDDAP